MGPSLPSPVRLQSALPAPFTPQTVESYQNYNGVIDVYVTNKSRDCGGRGLKHGCLIGALEELRQELKLSQKLLQIQPNAWKDNCPLLPAPSQTGTVPVTTHHGEHC